MSECGCIPFCETHGQAFIAKDAKSGDLYCGECASDGWSGELCWPDAEGYSEEIVRRARGDVLKIELDRFEGEAICPECRQQKVALIMQAVNGQNKMEVVDE